MLFKYSGKYVNIYFNMKITFSYTKVTRNTHTKKQEIVSIPLMLVPYLA